MHAVARILAVAYVALALFAGGVYAAVTANHLNVTEVQGAYARAPQEHVHVASVWLNWSGDAADLAIAVVNITVHNPGKVAVLVVGINFALHMDDPSDPREWWDPQKLELTRIQLIEISYTRERGIAVPAGDTVTLSSTVHVLPNSELMVTFDKPDGDGRYHPVVWGPWLVYTFADFDLPFEPVYTVPFHEDVGVVPGG